ncbi:MAG: hypothetical protein H0V54_11625 [Chthoniobacterales bacterium]|nr:hypothetical protein [Chthoniobacterales bacterium]
MRFAQPGNPFLHRLQMIAKAAAATHFPKSPGLRRRRDDRFLMDIESQIEFFIHWCVCLFELLNCNAPAPAVGAALLHLKKASSPRNMNGKHTLFFNPMSAPSHRARSHKVWAAILGWRRME